MATSQATPDDRKPVTFEEIFAAEASLLGSTASSVSTAAEFNGLALSGGGIRTATFALGVVQVLVGKGLLEKFHYMSTVSGGGYTGGMLSWYLSGETERQRQEEFAAADKRAGELDDRAAGTKRTDLSKPFGLSKANFPLGTGDPADKLGNRSLPRFLRQHGKYLTPGAGITTLSLVAVVLRGMLLNLLVWFPLVAAFFYLGNGFLAVVAPAVAKASLAVFAVVCVLYSVVWGSAAWKSDTAAVGSNRAPYRGRRAFELCAPWVLGFAGALLILHAIPLTHGAITRALVGATASAETGSAQTTVAGSLVSLLGAGSTLLMGRKRMRASIVAPLGAALLLFGLAIAAYGVSLEINDLWRSGLLAFCGVALVSGWLANLNHVGVQRYYRDRLMETFLPNLRSALDNNTGKAELAENFRLTSMGFKPDGKSERLYHLINTNVVLVDSGYRSYRTRGGDGFLLSKAHCGSRATGYIETQQFVNGQVSLATAIATSGAAVNPNTGVAGSGITRSRAVSLLLALLNLRLGLWVRNPKSRWRFGKRLERLRTSTPSHFGSLLYEVLGKYKEDSSFLQLTDGGHFENLGLYELVRRRCKTILAVDGTADPGFRFADLQNAFRLIETDFQVRVIPIRTDLSDMVPRTNLGFPKDCRASSKCWGHWQISYGDDPKQRTDLFYVTTTYLEGLPLEIAGYKADHPEFPDESTADQFFDQHQFEAHRKLGVFIGEKLIADSDFAKGF